MKKLLPTIALLLMALNADAQCYPVFRDMARQPQFHTSEAIDRNFPYFYRYSYDTYKNTDSSYVLYSYFDGSNWNKIGPHVIRGYSMRLLKWGNRILGFGTVYRINGMNAPAGKYFAVLEYKAGRWDSIPGCTVDSGVFTQVCANAQSLFVLYPNKQVPGKGSVFQYDTNTSKFVKIIDYESYNYNRLSLMAGTNRMLLSNVNKVNGLATKGFAYIENDTVKLNTGGGFDEWQNYAIDKVTDHIYSMKLQSDPVVYEFGTSVMPPRNTKLKINSAYDPLHVSNGILIWMSFVAGNAYDKYHNILCPGDSIWKQIMSLRSSGVSLTNPYAAVNGIYSYRNFNNNSKAVRLDNGVLLKGTAYIDLDSNCNPDSGEHRLKNYVVYGQSEDFLTSTQTDDSGRYELYVLEDTVKVHGAGKLPACAGTNQIIAQTGVSNVRHVPVMDPGGYDVKLKLLSQKRVRWNTKEFYGLLIENNGYPLDSVDLNVVLDPRIDADITGTDFISANNNNAFGRVYGLDYYEKRWVYLKAWIDTATTKPDSVLCHKAFASIDSLEFNYANNSDSDCQMVVYSYDPNYKDCSHKTIKPQVSTKLDYYIEFQNEGNDDAWDVVVIDAMSRKLDYKTLVINSVSHPYTVSFAEGQLKFTFKDIHLKPKKENEALSKGFIDFSISTVKGLLNGDSILNNAYIYFDLNAPVITNFAVVKVDVSSSVGELISTGSSELLMYPNPANDKLNVKTSSDEPIYIYNLLGALIAVVEPVDGYALIDISALPDGIYILRCGRASGKFIKQD